MKILIQIGAGMGDLDPRNQYKDGFTDFVKKKLQTKFYDNFDIRGYDLMFQKKMSLILYLKTKYFTPNIKKMYAK